MPRPNNTSRLKSSKLKRSARISKRRLILFGTIFALAGSYAIIHSFADVISNPTHIIDEQWNFPANANGYSDISVDMSPKADGTPDGYFYANEFYFPGNGGVTPAGGAATGYIGLQDEGNDGAGNTLPKSVLFQIYGAVSGAASAGSIEACGNPSGEGPGCYIHLSYNWVVNHVYRFDVSLQTANSGGNNVWLGQFTDLTTGVTTQLGTLDMPTSYDLLSSAVITFHERFSGPTASCSDITTSFVTFANVTAQNNSISASPSSTFSSGVDQSQCPGFVYNSLQNNVIYSGYGPNVGSYEPSAPTPVSSPTPTPSPATPKTTISASNSSPPASTTPSNTTPSPSTTTNASHNNVNSEQRSSSTNSKQPLKVKSTLPVKHSRWLPIIIGLLAIAGIGTGLIYYFIHRSSTAGSIY